MGLFDKIKKGFKSALAYAKMDDFLIEYIDGVLCERWQKVSERKPANVAGISLEEEAEYNFIYQHQGNTIRVELEHEYPMLEIEVQSGFNKYETRIQVSDFVEKAGTDFFIKNETELRHIITEMAEMVE
ncbi:hypothetical protein [Desulfobacula toluolica]|uniref:Uncharacterized protein n=1 Tax=Desulfobacula toluolica (strain DSM 7467 / Tol2) TaxID=651182 RepID=K0NPZ3_DESTT|nr:hypothetical protein [Desulfobacula toluolica]CCK82228.1 uncharacterized protein TOL2_C40720 [Desulfobacula toluolica Tol2]